MGKSTAPLAPHTHRRTHMKCALIHRFVFLNFEPNVFFFFCKNLLFTKIEIYIDLFSLNVVKNKGCRLIDQTCRESKVMLCVAHVLRYAPAYKVYFFMILLIFFFVTTHALRTDTLFFFFCLLRKKEEVLKKNKTKSNLPAPSPSFFFAHKIVFVERSLHAWFILKNLKKKFLENRRAHSEGCDWWCYSNCPS